MNISWPWSFIARFFVVLGVSLLVASPAVSSPVLRVDDFARMLPAASYMEYLEDSDGALTIADVTSSAVLSRFRSAAAARTGGGDINFGYSNSAFWLKLTLQSDSHIPQLRLLEIAFPTLDRIELYREGETGWTRLVMGDRLPYSTRPLRHPNFVVPLSLEQGQTTVYMRVSSAGTLTTPVRLWRQEAFTAYDQRLHTLLALYFGMMLALLLYNLMLYISLRDRNYMNYVLAALGMTLGQLALSGLGSQYLWPDWPNLGNVALPFGFGVAGFFGARFVQSFLETKLTSPRHHQVMSVFAGLFLFTVILPVWVVYQWAAVMVSVLGVLFPAFAISNAVICWHRSNRSALLFLLAWTMPLIGTFLLGLRNLGWVPSNFLSVYALMIGSALEMLLLSFALADRVQNLRREKEAAQSDAIFAIGHLLRSVINAIPEYIFYKDRNGVFLGCNTAFEDFLGRSEQEIVGYTGFDLFPRDRATLFHEQDVYVITSGQSLSHEEWMQHADGRSLFVEQNKWPLRDPSGQVIGLVGIVRDRTERHRLVEQERFRNRIFELLAYNNNLSDILREIVLYIEQLHEGMIASILLLDEDGQHLRLGASCSLPDFIEQAIDGLLVAEDSTPCGTAAFRNERVIAENLQTDLTLAAYRDMAARANLCACWSEPIHSAKGAVLGTFAVYLHHPGLPTLEDVKLLQQAATLASIAIERKRAEDTIWRQANYDTVTHLPNRRLFRDRLEQEIRRAQREQKRLALLFIDLDRFKEVNDTLGHDAGDTLLVEAAHRISATIRDTDTAARIGGDEFTIIMPQLLDNRRVEEVAQKLVDALAVPFKIGHELAYLSGSIGITIYPNDALDLENLLKNADQAMYVAKSWGRSCYSFFTSGMQESALQRQALMRDLRVALANNEFRLYFQPIVEIGSGAIVKAEALIRWQHPVRGLVSPQDFIPLAEEIGLIGDIGDWVLRESLFWMQRWHARGASCRQVSVNMSPNQFIGEASEVWLDQLRKSGLPGECLIIEITEGVLLNERASVTDKLAQLRAAGVQIAVDDFGTGYSALAYLKKFDVDFLKIDRSFVRDLATDPSDLALSEAIIVMASKLGLRVVAEGVETVEQRNILSTAGCNLAQGYLYAKPMPVEEFDAQLV